MIYVGDEKVELALSAEVNRSQAIGLQFDCWRSYEEKTVYLKGKDRIEFSLLYNYASFQYRLNDLLPQIAVDKNYYAIPNPYFSIVGDVYSRGLDIQISDLNLEVEIQALIESYNHIDVEQALFEMGFKHIDLQTIFSKGTQITKKLSLFAKD
jgi:hypothetical protein